MARLGHLLVLGAGLVVLPAAFILFGASFTWRTGGALLDGLSSRSWPSVPGTIRRAAFGDHRDGDLSYVKGIVARYPKGLLVSVFFDPLQPTDAVLEPGVSGSNVLFLGISLFFFVVGLAWGIASIQVLRQHKSADG